MDDTRTRTPGHEPQRSTRAWEAAGPPHSDGTDWARAARIWMIVLALVVLSLSLLTALIAANQAVTIWLQPQYAPFVRTVGALVVAAIALYVVMRLTRRSP